MSLETEIKKLTEAVEKLNANLLKVFGQESEQHGINNPVRLSKEQLEVANKQISQQLIETTKVTTLPHPKVTTVTTLLTSETTSRGTSRSDGDYSVSHAVPSPELVTLTTKELKPTHDDIRKLCLQLNRKNPENKIKLKAILTKYGNATKIDDIPLDKIEEAMKEINAGNF